jgi:hypothetical protein
VQTEHVERVFRRLGYCRNQLHPQANRSPMAYDCESFRRKRDLETPAQLLTGHFLRHVHHEFATFLIGLAQQTAELVQVPRILAGSNCCQNSLEFLLSRGSPVRIWAGAPLFQSSSRTTEVLPVAEKLSRFTYQSLGKRCISTSQFIDFPAFVPQILRSFLIGPLRLFIRGPPSVFSLADRGTTTKAQSD